MRFLAGYIMRGPMQAVLVASVCALASLIFPPLSYLGGAAVGLVTLRHGAWEGVKAALGATVAVTGLSFLLVQSVVPGPAFLLAVWLPVWALAGELRRSVALPRALLLAGAVAAGFVVAVHAAVGDPASFWQKLFEEMLRQTGQPQSTADTMKDVYPVITGALAAGFALSLVGSLFIARWWQAQLFNPGGFQREFHALRFGRWFGLATLGVAGVAFAGKEALAAFASDVIIVMVVLLMLHGIAVVHGLVQQSNANVGWLVALYVLLVVTLPPTAITLSAVGVADAWFDFRTFFGARRQAGGDD